MKISKKIIFEIILFFIFMICIGAVILNKGMGNMDEIWNYNFANCVAKGMVPYRDFSIVQTPLLAFITGGVLKLTCNSLIVMRIMAVILGSSILMLVHKILDKLSVNKSINLLFSTGMLVVLQEYFCIDYNFFSILLTLMVIYLELNLDMSKKKNNLWLGIVAGLIVLTKQTIGLFICIGIVMYKFLLELYRHKKYDNKIDIKNILFRILGVSIPGILFLIYLLFTGALNDFIDYAVLGIKTFSNTISYTRLIESEELLIKFLAIYIPISYLIMAIYLLKNRKKEILIIMIYGLASMAIAFPISDNMHFLTAIIPSIIGTVYIIDKLIRKVYTSKLLFLKFFVESIVDTILIYVVVVSCINIYQSNNNYYSNLKHFEYIPISDGLEEKINAIDEYILNNNKKVYIVNFDAAIYQIPIDKYNKNFDMFMKGNFGSNGANGIISQIKNEDDAVYLILKHDDSKNWQHPTEVTDYIENNLKHIGSIENFEIFSK